MGPVLGRLRPESKLDRSPHQQRLMPKDSPTQPPTGLSPTCIVPWAREKHY